MNAKSYKYVLGLVLATSVSIVASLPDNRLHIIACDVGQGDATLVVYKNTQILVDGGPPNGKVLQCLSEHLPFWDRSIEMIVVTHPQIDHFGGLIQVMKSYQVDMVMVSGLSSSTLEYRLLETQVGVSGAQVVMAHEVTSIGNGLMRLDVVHPSRSFVRDLTSSVERSAPISLLGNYTSEDDPNDFSVVLVVSLGEFNALLTGDIGPEISDLIAEKLAGNKIKDFEYIKVPHHGSKNGLSEMLTKFTKPEIATISSGRDNRFGHPHKKILDLLKNKGVRILRTDQEGDIEVVSDGERFWVEK